MIIGDGRFAAAFVSAEGEFLKFDDIGCMKAYLQKNAAAAKNAWVHNYQSETWIDSEKAVFVHSAQLVTPMGYGLAAFSAVQEADKFLEKYGGEKISYKSIKGGTHSETN